MTCIGKRKSAALFLAAVLLCFVAQTVECYRLSKPARDDVRADAASAKTLRLREGKILFGRTFEEVFKSNIDGTKRPAGNDSTQDDDDFQADSAGSYMTQEASSKVADWNRMASSLQCGSEQLRLRAMGPGASGFALDQGAESPLPLNKVPSACGYNTLKNPLSLVMVAPYTGCHMQQEGGNHVLPMRWQGVPVLLWCPKSQATTTPVPQTEATTKVQVVTHLPKTTKPTPKPATTKTPKTTPQRAQAAPELPMMPWNLAYPPYPLPQGPQIPWNLAYPYLPHFQGPQLPLIPPPPAAPQTLTTTQRPTTTTQRPTTQRPTTTTRKPTTTTQKPTTTPQKPTQKPSDMRVHPVAWNPPIYVHVPWNAQPYQFPQIHMPQSAPSQPTTTATPTTKKPVTKKPTPGPTSTTQKPSDPEIVHVPQVPWNIPAYPHFTWNTQMYNQFPHFQVPQPLLDPTSQPTTAAATQKPTTTTQKPTTTEAPTTTAAPTTRKQTTQKPNPEVQVPHIPWNLPAYPIFSWNPQGYHHYPQVQVPHRPFNSPSQQATTRRPATTAAPTTKKPTTTRRPTTTPAPTTKKPAVAAPTQKPSDHRIQPLPQIPLVVPAYAHLAWNPSYYQIPDLYPTAPQTGSHTTQKPSLDAKPTKAPQISTAKPTKAPASETQKPPSDPRVPAMPWIQPPYFQAPLLPWAALPIPVSHPLYIPPPYPVPAGNSTGQSDKAEPPKVWVPHMPAHGAYMGNLPQSPFPKHQGTKAAN